MAAEIHERWVSTEPNDGRINNNEQQIYNIDVDDNTRDVVGMLHKTSEDLLELSEIRVTNGQHAVEFISAKRDRING